MNIINDQNGVTILEVLLSVVIGFALMTMVFLSFLYVWKEVGLWQRQSIDIIHEHRVADALKWDIWRSSKMQLSENQVVVSLKDREYVLQKENRQWIRNNRYLYPDSLLKIEVYRQSSVDGDASSGIKIMFYDDEMTIKRSTIIYPRSPHSWKPIR